jgi:hypothetical protein
MKKFTLHLSGVILLSVFSLNLSGQNDLKSGLQTSADPESYRWEYLTSLPSDEIPYSLQVVDTFVIWSSSQADWSTDPIPHEGVTVFRSIDAGNTWQSHVIPNTLALGSNNLTAVDSLNAWIHVDSKGLMKTTDGGKSWNIINNQFRNQYVHIHFFDLNEGFAVIKYTSIPKCSNDSMKLATTADGGTHWNFLDPKTWGNNLQNESPIVLFGSNWGISGDTIIFGTSRGRIFTSYNRGQNWSVQHTGLGDLAVISSADFITSKKIMVCSFSRIVENGDIYYYTENKNVSLSYSDDGGTSWNNLPTVNMYAGNVSAIPKTKKFILSGYKIWLYDGGTYISENGEPFEKIDSACNISGTDFYNEKHGFGVSFNANDSRYANPLQGEIMKWIDFPTGNKTIREDKQPYIYPNPAIEYIVVSLPEGNSSANMEILDLEGRIIWTGTVYNNKQVTLGGYDKGVYLYHVTFGQRSFTGKLIIQ